jgi:hypothetical protein
VSIEWVLMTGGGRVGGEEVELGVVDALDGAGEEAGELGAWGDRGELVGELGGEEWCTAGEAGTCMLGRAGKERTGGGCVCARSKRKSRELAGRAREV